MLNLAGRTAVVVGGGPVAVRRAESLVAAECQVLVIAPEVGLILDSPGITVEQRPYQSGDLAGAFLVVVATNDPTVNQAICDEARDRGVLVNRADESEKGDFVVPAQHRAGTLTIAVSTDGISPKAASEICEELRGQLDGDWISLLGTLEPFRQEVKKRVEDSGQRQILLRQFVDDEAMGVLKADGEEALAAHYRHLLEEATG
jgi:precorrin-2 dehydrogenase/sirohydrochlorin ferrochelatase